MQLVAEQAQAMTIPPQDLDQITALAAKDEDMAAEGIQFDCHTTSISLWC